MQAERRGASHPQIGFVAPFEIIGERADPPFGQYHRAGLLEHPGAECGGDDSLARAYHDLETETAFHQLHVSGQCRLCEAERHCGPGEGSGSDDLVKLQ